MLPSSQDCHPRRPVRTALGGGRVTHRCDRVWPPLEREERARRWQSASGRLARRRTRIEPWSPIVLTEPVRLGGVWAGTGQLLLPLPGVPTPRQAEPVERQMAAERLVMAA